MEHHPYLSFENGLEITYSDLKKKKNGSEYVTIYFEQPNAEKTDFVSAQCDYPGGSFRSVVGYTKEDLQALWEHVARVGELVLNYSREDRYA